MGVQAEWRGWRSGMGAWGLWIAAGAWSCAERVVACAINLQGGLLTSSPEVRYWSLALDFAGVEAARCVLVRSDLYIFHNET